MLLLASEQSIKEPCLQRYGQNTICFLLAINTRDTLYYRNKAVLLC